MSLESIFDDIGEAFKISNVALADVPLIRQTVADAFAAFQADKIAFSDVMQLVHDFEAVLPAKQSAPDPAPTQQENPPQEGMPVSGSDGDAPADPNAPQPTTLAPSEPGTTADDLNKEQLDAIAGISAHFYAKFGIPRLDHPTR